jgi:hypothetical protein
VEYNRSDIPNLLNYCVVFIVYEEFTDVAVSLIIQSRGPHATHRPRDETGLLLVFYYYLKYSDIS